MYKIQLVRFVERLVVGHSKSIVQKIFDLFFFHFEVYLCMKSCNYVHDLFLLNFQ